jgi:hypothetical protein
VKIAILFFLFSALNVFADATIRLQIAESSFKAGEIVSAELSLDASSAQSFSLQSIKGQVLSGTLYFQSISPLIHRENQSSYVADAEIIFIKKPEAKDLSVSIANIPVLVSWNNVEIIPVEVPQKFIFMDFEIPSPTKFLIWLALLSGCLLLGWGIWKLKDKIDKKNNLKNLRKKLKEEIISCRNYSEVVQFWQKKRFYIEIFPEIEIPLQKFEAVLFKFQFKPNQTESEQNLAMDAYRAFKKDIEGSLSGV